ncbi:hypothetical protein KOW79_016609 [Hemibagrus wyckioides]|uniref:Uncharacterized protein n=1 Tax=Hemibagrus wyckioides TaxID=337641 RepID=A0A9D3N9W6_9TELE|nr:hypothetical protein KOW79_016609 [Hemibagrus wyckioides]
MFLIWQKGKLNLTPAMDVLTIHVVTNSSDTTVFRVQVRCSDHFLLNFWLHKMFYDNGEVQQTSVVMQEDSAGIEFVLRVLHRSSRLLNDYYLSPFLVTLCLDALVFHYQLPPQPNWDGTIREALRGNRSCLDRELLLQHKQPGLRRTVTPWKM